MFKKNDLTNELDLQITSESLLSTEDKIFVTLMKEKGATKGELTKLTGVLYTEIRKNIINMENKGYVVGSRIDDLVYFYLTMAGAYEAEDRLNSETVNAYFNYLTDKGYDYQNVQKFLKNRFCKFYIAGEWNPTTLDEQYMEWCDSNNLTYTKSHTKKLQYTK